MSALMLAARGGHNKTIKTLIEAGADVNLINQVDLYTCCCALKTNLLQVYFVQKVYLTSHPQQNQVTALELAAKGGHATTVKTLIEAGADNLKLSVSTCSYIDTCRIHLSHVCLYLIDYSTKTLLLC